LKESDVQLAGAEPLKKVEGTWGEKPNKVESDAKNNVGRRKGKWNTFGSFEFPSHAIRKCPFGRRARLSEHFGIEKGEKA
jgi:hypothetical protein